MQAFIPQKDARGCIVPNFIFYHNELSNGAKMLYTILGSYARAKDFCYPAKSTLATKLNCSINTLKSWLKQLLSHGFIKIKQTAQGEVFYLFSPTKTESQSSKIDSEVSKIDTKVNIKNLNNIIKTPYIPPKKYNAEKTSRVG